jgi:hypothetical protein
MATIKKTITGLKPATNYLFSLKPKNTEISAIDVIPDTIRVQTPGVVSTPSLITGVALAANYKSAMLTFNHVSMVDLDYYEYKIYKVDGSNEVAINSRQSTIDQYPISGLTKSNLVVISNLDNTTLTGASPTLVAYRAKVRTVNTGGNAGPWSSPSGSSNTELIENQFIQNLTASKIEAGTIGAHEIILTQPGIQTSYTPPNDTAVLRSSNYVEGSAGWIIRGNGTAEFDYTNIRGSLTASSISLNDHNYWLPNSANPIFKVGNNSKNFQWDGANLTTTGSLITNATVSGGTVGGVTVGSGATADRFYIGNGAFNNANTAFYVDSAGQFSLKDKFVWTGNALTIAGDVTIHGTIASTVVGNAATGAGDPATRINAGSTTITGGKIRTGLIDSNNLSWDGATTYTLAGTRINLDDGQIVSKNFRIDSSGNATFGGAISGGSVTGSTIQNAASSPTFKVDTSGNVFANNIYATGSSAGTALGLQIRADGDPATGNPNYSTNGAIWLLSGTGKETKIGNTLGALNTRWRAADAALPSVPAAVILEPAWNTSGSTWSQQRHFEINMAKDFNFYVNTDIILRGDALDGTGNDYFTDDASQIAGGEDARYVQGTYKGRLMWIISRSGSSIRYKENVESVSNDEALNSINKLKLKKFTYKRNEKFDTEDSYKFKQLDYDYGFIAEEVAEVMPWLATYTITEAGKEKIQSNFEDEDLNNPDYVQVENWKRYAVVSMLVGSVQSLNKRIESLEAQLAAQ